MIIIKRDGSKHSFNPTKIYNRIKKSAKGLKVNSEEIFIKVVTSLPVEGEITTNELDNLISEISYPYTSSHYDYSKFASHVAISSHNKSTNISFCETMKDLYSQGIIHKNLINTIESYGAEEIDALIDHNRDLNFDYFGWKSLQGMYLLKNSNGVVVERPQHMYMRVALWLTNSIEEAKEYYDSLSNQLISPATPIMINSGTKIPQLASCVLTYNAGDSREGLLSTLNDISTYSADAAGIGLCMSNIRSRDSKISKTGGYAGGLLKYLKIVNESLRFFNQQGRRPGSAAIYIEPWHRDIVDLLDIKKNTGAEELRARDLFTALWIPDNFMRAVKDDADYYLFCPNDIIKNKLKPLQDLYGEEFDKEYEKAVNLGIGKKVKAQDIWKKIIESQIETGVPYMASKDNTNKKTNHRNIGTIKQSNLCIEIVQYTDEDTTAICTLSSLVIKNFITFKKNSDALPIFDFNLLYSEVRKIVKGLNKVIDINSYSTDKGKKGGKEQRAIGIGVQGLADVFFLMDYEFTSDEAKDLNKKIFETIYFAALTESNELCKNGEYKPYKFFKDSPISKGEFQFDMWGINRNSLSGMWDWNTLGENIIKYGVCNSLVTAQMPVASSARVTGSFEMTEPISSNLFSRRVGDGEFVITNKYLIEDLEVIDMWSDQLKNEIIMNDGSIQNINFNKYLSDKDENYENKIKRIEHIIKKYKTIWEISQKEIIYMAADRGPFIDQSQSMNIHMSNPSIAKIHSSHFFAWESGLKTMSYYIRTRAISTGAKHLGTDISQFMETNSSKLIEPEVVQKPEGSQFDCVGCSS